MLGDPSCGSKLWEALDGAISESGELRRQEVANGDSQPTASFLLPRESRNFRPRQWTADVQQVLSTPIGWRRRCSALSLPASILQMTIQRAEAQPPSPTKLACGAYPPHKAQTQTVELPLVYVAWALTILFLRSSGYSNTDAAIRTGGLVRRLRGSTGTSPPCASYSTSLYGSATSKTIR